jgi:hypothetical protein
VEDVERCNALLVGGTKFTQNNAHLFCEQVSCDFQMAFMVPQRREVLSITKENSTDLGIKQKITENGIKPPHTKTDRTSAQCFVNCNTSEFNRSFIAFRLCLGSGCQGQCYSPE